MRWVVLLAVARVVGAAPCARTGAEAPSVSTLMASKENPSTDAWIVTPTCDVTVFTASTFGELKMTSGDYERIDSVPTGIKALTIAYPTLTKGADLTSGSSLTSVNFYQAVVDLGSVKFPSSATSITLDGEKIGGIKAVAWPSGLKSLYIANNGITAIDFPLPSKIQDFELTGLGPLPLTRISFPDSLRSLTLGGTSIVYGVKWPRSLVTLKLGTSSVPSFEIRESDLTIFSKLATFEPSVSQSSCRQSTARLQTVNSKALCVITDALAESLYGIPNTGGSVTTPSPASTKDSGGSKASESSKSSAGSGSGSQSKKSSSTKTTSSGSTEKETSPGVSPKSPNSNSNSSTLVGVSTSSTSSDFPGDFEDGTPPRGRTATPDIPSGIKGKTKTSDGGMNSLVYILLAGGVVVVTVVAILGLRVCRLSRNIKEETEVSTEQGYAGHTDKWTTTNSGVGSSSAPRSTDKGSSQGYVSNDVRNDKSLIPFRIESNDIQLGPMLARGGFGIIFRGTYKSRAVAVKQMLPGSWKDDDTLSKFMDEIRMCAKLEHPRIVEFIGMAWKSRRDLSVITELMGGGDLHSKLYKHRDAVSKDWVKPWGSSSIKCKAAIAQDVAEAVVYLHSFSSPILHRDLKAKNVLLNEAGNAKLSDFGITRELELDKTMTAEVGTSAWIAPEVLRGERYSEMADIYSFGVLLVEMDLCRHPLGDHLKSSDTSLSGAFRNAQLIMAVSNGELRPAVSSDCPASVGQLAEWCLRYDPEQRPTAMEVFYMLRQVPREQ